MRSTLRSGGFASFASPQRARARGLAIGSQDLLCGPRRARRVGRRDPVLAAKTAARASSSATAWRAQPTRTAPARAGPRIRPRPTLRASEGRSEGPSPRWPRPGPGCAPRSARPSQRAPPTGSEPRRPASCAPARASPYSPWRSKLRASPADQAPPRTRGKAAVGARAKRRPGPRRPPRGRQQRPEHGKERRLLPLRAIYRRSVERSEVTAPPARSSRSARRPSFVR